MQQHCSQVFLQESCTYSTSVNVHTFTIVRKLGLPWFHFLKPLMHPHSHTLFTKKTSLAFLRYMILLQLEVVSHIRCMIVKGHTLLTYLIRLQLTNSQVTQRKKKNCIGTLNIQWLLYTLF